MSAAACCPDGSLLISVRVCERECVYMCEESVCVCMWPPSTSPRPPLLLLLLPGRKLLGQYKWDLRAWRRQEEKKASKEMLEGFQMLDLNDGSGWDLLCKLMSFNPSDR